MDSVSFVRLALLLCAIWDQRRTETADLPKMKLSAVDLKILRDKIGKNTVVSSFAFRLPLCKLALVATPITRHEIISVLDIHTLSETKTCYSNLFPALASLVETDLTMLNKIYVNYTDQIDDQFILRAPAHGLTVSKIGFHYRQDAVAYVNREFSSKTYMRIRDILELNDIDEYSSILLVNGFHYKATWETVFKQTSTQTKQFHSGNQTLQMQMMHAVTQCLYLNDAREDYKAISLHLSQGGMTMTILLPNRNSSIVRLLHTMTQNSSFFDSINKKMEWKFVKVTIPKFKIKTNLDWTPYLKQIGLNLTTDMNNTGLNGILKDEDTTSNMYVSKAKQKIFVEIDEGPSRNKQVGLEDTPLVLRELERDPPESPPVPLEDFTVDGPFYFTVTITVPPTARRRQKRIFHVLNGIYYKPE